MLLRTCCIPVCSICVWRQLVSQKQAEIYYITKIYTYTLTFLTQTKKSNNGGLNWKTLKPQIQCSLFNFPQPRCCDRGCVVMQFAPHEVNIHRTGCLKTIVWVSLKIDIIIIYIHMIVCLDESRSFIFVFSFEFQESP